MQATKLRLRIGLYVVRVSTVHPKLVGLHKMKLIELKVENSNYSRPTNNSFKNLFILRKSESLMR